MSRILAIDYGRKRAGIAVTDELQIIATGLTTVPSHELIAFLKEYTGKEKVDLIVVGEPRDMMNRPSEATRFIEPFVAKLKAQFPTMDVKRFDERFTSKMAHQAMLDGGLKKKKRQDKALVDTLSATLILQSYMESIKF
ncbi:MAG: Holliday junction resolvase RuvX [Bacteroidales bacterium]|nr:Holliday junction resolvase RuvX [Bacteroidales bacterium]